MSFNNVFAQTPLYIDNSKKRNMPFVFFSSNCMFKKAYPIFIEYSMYENGPDFLDTQYIYSYISYSLTLFVLRFHFQVVAVGEIWTYNIGCRRLWYFWVLLHCLHLAILYIQF